mgnify:CR=1 FL=1
MSKIRHNLQIIGSEIAQSCNAAKRQPEEVQLLAVSKRHSPEAIIEVASHGDSSVNIICRPWVKKEDYWAVHFYMHEQVKLAFDKEGISIPFPQRDIHIIDKMK